MRPYCLTVAALIVWAGWCCTTCLAAANATSGENSTVAGLTGAFSGGDLTPLENVTASLPGTDIVLQDGPTGDCAEPSRVNLDKGLAEDADIVITGVVVEAAPGEATCVPPSGLVRATEGATDLLVDYNKPPADGSTTLLVIAQCVHKGVLACRRNSADSANGTVVDTLGRCVVAVNVPVQAAAEGDSLPPCSVTPGFRYMMLLSSKPQAACDGAYTTAHARVVDSIKPHLGNNLCVPYPSWPSQNTNSTGDGIAAMLASTCPGAATGRPVECGASRDSCKSKLQCPPGAAITCVTKACEGRYMVQGYVSPVEPCVPVFVSQVTGLPVPACNVTATQLLRQAKQAKQRTGMATGKVSPTQTQVNPTTGRPTLLPPDQLFASRFANSASNLLSSPRPAQQPPPPTAELQQKP